LLWCADLHGKTQVQRFESGRYRRHDVISNPTGKLHPVPYKPHNARRPQVVHRNVKPHALDACRSIFQTIFECVDVENPVAVYSPKRCSLYPNVDIWKSIRVPFFNKNTKRKRLTSAGIAARSIMGEHAIRHGVCVTWFLSRCAHSHIVHNTTTTTLITTEK
jgi:hypothetical protein